MGLRILVIGSGGREHAIAQKLISSPLVSHVFCAPGNPGMKNDGIQLVKIEESEHSRLIQFAKDNRIDWTFVGPEIPLLRGIVDDFLRSGLHIFGPKKKAALIEGSKDFAKQLMVEASIPTASYRTFDNFQEARTFIEKKGVPIVIKADGLAAGKGVVVATTFDQAIEALKDMLEENKFGSSGSKVVIEEFLSGEEFSLLAFVKGERVYPMVIAQDHKRAYDNDLGPNTGGMGAYAPVPQIPDELVSEAVQNVLLPAAKILVSKGRSFTGILYAGLIATKEGIKTIEFNARFGDPETQVVLQRLDSDLAEIIDDLLNDKEPEVRWKKSGYSLGVVVAADGYPKEYRTNLLLPKAMLTKTENIYYAGVKEKEGCLVSSGGRVYLLEATGETLQQAQEKVYETLANLDTQGTFYRKDIGSKGIEAEKHNIHIDLEEK